MLNLQKNNSGASIRKIFSIEILRFENLIILSSAESIPILISANWAFVRALLGSFKNSTLKSQLRSMLWFNLAKALHTSIARIGLPPSSQSQK